ncbi:MAG: hypothetical protein U1E65_19210 [Myxococcota bacterium]
MPSDDPLLRALDALLAERIPEGRPELPWPPHAARLWEPSQFGLDRSSAWQAADEQDQRLIHALVARSTLEEAYFLEKIGLAYCARAAHLADTTEASMLYALFAAEEAAHVRTLAKHLPDNRPTPEKTGLAAVTAQAIEQGSEATAGFVAQVLLEGWIVDHYSALARACRSDGLRLAFLSIAKEEGAHHEAGVIVAKHRAAKPSADLVDITSAVLAELAAGPQKVRAAIDRVLGGLSPSDAEQLFVELAAEPETAAALEAIRQRMLAAGASALVEALEARQAFRPWNPRVAARARR